MKITKKQIEKLVESIVKEETENYSLDQAIFSLKMAISELTGTEQNMALYHVLEALNTVKKVKAKQGASAPVVSEGSEEDRYFEEFQARDPRANKKYKVPPPTENWRKYRGPMDQEDIETCLFCDEPSTRFEPSPSAQELAHDDSIQFSCCDDPVCNKHMDNLLAYDGWSV